MVEEDVVEKRGNAGIWTVEPKFVQVKNTPKAAFVRPEAPAKKAPLTPKQLEIKALSDALGSRRQVNAMGGA